MASESASVRVMFLSSNIGLFGAEGVILNLFKKLPSAARIYLGNFINQQNPHDELAVAASHLGAVVKKIDCSGPLDFKAIKKLVQIIQEEKIDIIHSHGYKSDFYGIAAAKLTGRPIVSTLHSLNWEEKKVGFYIKIQKYIFRYFNAVVCVSEKLIQEMRETSVSREKLIIIDNGIDVESYKLDKSDKWKMAEKFQLSEKAEFIGTAGRLSLEKGQDVLIKAAAILAKDFPDACFLIAGSGPQEASLKQLVEELKLGERVKFLGLVGDMVSYYNALDIFVLPSLTEGLPLVILEAMASGLPVVASDVGAVSRAVEAQKTGALVEAGNEVALAKAIKQVISDKVKMGDMGQTARKVVKEKFSAVTMAQEYFDLYQNIIAAEGKN